MTNEQRKQIYLLRKSGLGYKAISKATGVSRDSVRSFCKTRGMDGYVGEKGVIRQKIKNGELCMYCAGEINKAATGRPAKFCCNECRRAYWKIHRSEVKRSCEATYIMECKYCHETFESYGNKHRKYCCHEHYIYDRFGYFDISEVEFNE